MELDKARAEAGKYGFVGEMRLVQCRADSVKHVASPSRCDRSQRVVMSPVISTSVRRSRTSQCPAPLRRAPQSVSQPCLGFAFLAAALVRCAFSLIRSAVALGEIWTQNNRSHIAMSYEPSIAWKASLRAHRRRSARPLKVLKPRWPRRTVERRERFNNYTMVQF